MKGPALIVVLLASAAAHADKAWVFEPGQTLVYVQMGPARARISATSLNLGGRVIELPDGGAQAEIHVALASFGTGQPARDEKLQQQSDAERFPEIVFEGKAPPANDGTLRFEGTLKVHGVSRAVTIPVEMVRAAGLTFGHTAIIVHLRAFGFALPDGVSDELRVDVDAGMRPEGALVSRG
jgi:polyisoprenoid-binding protein YceI